jgi:PilZ domain-containing protein
MKRSNLAYIDTVTFWRRAPLMGRNRRKTFRVEWNLPAIIYDLDRKLDRPCILSNFSNGGAQITGIRANTIPDEFILQIGRGDRRKCRVLWRTDDTLGAEFADCVPRDPDPAEERTSDDEQTAVVGLL